MHTPKIAEKIKMMEARAEAAEYEARHTPRKPNDFIHTDDEGNDYVVITHTIKKDGNYGIEQYRRYLMPLDEETAHRSFIPMAPC